MKRTFQIMLLVISMITVASVKESKAQCGYVYIGQGGIVYAEYCVFGSGVYPSGSCAFDVYGTLQYFCVAPELPGGQNFTPTIDNLNELLSDAIIILDIKENNIPDNEFSNWVTDIQTDQKSFISKLFLKDSSL